MIAQHSVCSCHHFAVLCLWLWETEVFEDGDKIGAAALLLFPAASEGQQLSWEET